MTEPHYVAGFAKHAVAAARASQADWSLLEDYYLCLQLAPLTLLGEADLESTEAKRARSVELQRWEPLLQPALSRQESRGALRDLQPLSAPTVVIARVTRGLRETPTQETNPRGS